MRGSTIIMAIAALAACLPLQAADDFFGGGDDTGKIVINAADAKKVVPPMRMVDDATAAKGKRLEIPDSAKGAPKIKGGEAQFEFVVKEDGKYYLHMRAFWPDACANSMYVEVAGKPKKKIEDSTVEHWHWVPLKMAVFKLKKGKTTLVVKNREDGARFDQVLLTTDKDAVPVGIEE